MKPESPGHSMQYQHYYSHASSSTALVVEIVIATRRDPRRLVSVRNPTVLVLYYVEHSTRQMEG